MAPRGGKRYQKGEPHPDLTAEADRFRAERIQMQLATEPVDEAAVEDLLCQAYAAAGLGAPGHIHWLDGPLELVAILTDGMPWIFVDEQYRERVPQCAWDDARLDCDEIAYLTSSILESVDHRVGQVRRLAKERSNARVKSVGGLHVEGGVWGRVVSPIWDAVRTEVSERIWRVVGESVGWRAGPRLRDSMWGNPGYSLWHSIRSYDDAPLLAEVRFYDEYYTRNEAHALARFNELTSGVLAGPSGSAAGASSPASLPR